MSNPNKLRAVISNGTTLEEALITAVDLYNEIDLRKVFHKADIVEDTASQYNRYQLIIWFTVMEDTPVVEPPTFIGSRGIDPNDPNWREKLAQKTVWDKDRFESTSGNTPVTSQEALRATETTKE